MIELNKTEAQWKLIFDSRGKLYDLFMKKFWNDHEIIIEKKNNQQEDILVYQWINHEWILIQCWEIKLTDLFASVIGSHQLESELQRNSKNYPKEVQHLAVFVKPSSNTLAHTSKSAWDIQAITTALMQKVPWVRYSFHNSISLALDKIRYWIKKPPIPMDCGIPVLNVEDSKSIITGMAALMNGMTTELATFCIFKIKKMFKKDMVSLRDLTEVPYQSWEDWFKEKANRNQKVLARKWFIILNGIDFFIKINEENEYL
ncbi:MAG: hypothetical protein ACTSR3_01285 [Candidatus Helarchaeota archaeon]